MYFKVIGPDKKLNESFIEKMVNNKFSILNNFIETNEMKYDPDALKKLFNFTKFFRHNINRKMDGILF